MDHPPYSPDLAPSDFWLFDYIKERLTSNSDAKSLMKQITGIVNSIPKEEYKKTLFQKGTERMELCIQNNGDYFEHLLN
jgi:histone-lysine N-methyltransferase SETMAR